MLANDEGCRVHGKWFHAQKTRTSQASQPTTRVNIGSVVQIVSGPKKGKKRKWDKNPPKDKGTLVEKKSQDVAKVWCFNYKELGHFAKDYEKVRQD